MNAELTIREKQEIRQFAGQTAWELAKRLIIDECPLVEFWLSVTRFVAWVPGSFILGIAREQRFFRESMIRYEPMIERWVRQVLGRRGAGLDLHIILLDSPQTDDDCEWDAFE